MTASVFMTEAGVEVPAITIDQMREVDRIAIDEVGPNLYQMMENAGRNLAQAAIELLNAAWQTTPIVVLARTGGNGGGGICAGRHLANRGADVTVVIGDEEHLSAVPAEQLHIYRATSGRTAGLADIRRVDPGLVLDSIIGYSLSGAPRGVAAEMIGWIGVQNSPVISLDVPSGIDSTTGLAAGTHVQATQTLTLALPKTGLDSEPIGELWLGDLGIPADVYRRLAIDVDSRTFGKRFRIRLRKASNGNEIPADENK